MFDHTTGVNVSLASLYLAEISPRKIRGAVGTCHQLFITIGILWSMVLGLPEITGKYTCTTFMYFLVAVSTVTRAAGLLPFYKNIFIDLHIHLND